MSITKKEWNGMVVLVIFIALVPAAPYLLRLFGKDTIINPAEFNKAVAVLSKAQKQQSDDETTNAVPVYKKAADGVIIELNSSDSAKLTELPSHIQKIHLNKVGFDGLRHLSYLTFKQMNAIVQFREQRGEDACLNAVRNIVLLNDEILRKIEPYIELK